MRTVAFWMACLVTLLPIQATCLAQSPVRDVALRDGAMLMGTVTDDQGVPQPQREITICQQDRQVAVARTDSSGVYRLSNFRSGVYVAVVDSSANVFRAWSYGTAPPVAENRLNLAIPVVNPAPTVRGQSSFYECGDSSRLYDLMETNPLKSAAVIAALIAVPIAVIAHNQDNDDAS